jgi:hypothetical protein
VICKVDIKCNFVQALRLCTGRMAHRGSRGIALPFHDHGTIRGWEVSVTPRPLFAPGKTRYPLYRRLVGPQGLFGQVWKISSPPGFNPRTVQPVASRYTDYATWPTLWFVLLAKFYSGGQLEKNVMYEACSRYGRQKWCVQDFVWETREKELLGRLRHKL